MGDNKSELTKLTEMSITELENVINNLECKINLAKQVMSLRNQMGEYSPEQLKRKDERKKAAAKAKANKEAAKAAAQQ